MVRFLPLQHRHRTGICQSFLPEFGSVGRNIASLPDLRSRFCCAPSGRSDLWPLWRQDGPQGSARRDIAADGRRDGPGRLCARLSADRHLGRRYPDGLRFVQGIGVGGEWGGSVLLAMEWSKSHGNRGFIASWPQFGVPAGLFLANLAVIAFNFISGDKFLEWGWRVPFILSAILIVIGLWIRLGILETPVFSKLVAENKIEKAPVVEVMKRQPKSIILSALIRLAEQTPFYIFTAFVFSYGTTFLKVDRGLLLQRRTAVRRARAFHHPVIRIHFGPHRTETHLPAGRRPDGGRAALFSSACSIRATPR